MADKLTIQQKKEWAKLLFTKEGITTQKDLAGRVGVSQNTIGKWIEQEGWKKIRTSLIMTKSEELGRLYEQLTELNDFIGLRDKGQRFANTKEADTMVKLTTAIRTLETDTAISDVIEVAKSFVKWIQPHDLAKAQEITRLFDSYIKTLIK